MQLPHTLTQGAPQLRAALHREPPREGQLSKEVDALLQQQPGTSEALQRRLFMAQICWGPRPVRDDVAFFHVPEVDRLLFGDLRSTAQGWGLQPFALHQTPLRWP